MNKDKYTPFEFICGSGFSLFSVLCVGYSMGVITSQSEIVLFLFVY